MGKFNRETIKNLVQLCRIDCSEEEQDALLKDLGSIVAYVEQLSDIDTTHVRPCNHVLEGMSNVVREDVVSNIMPRELFLANVPSQVGGMVRVPPVMKSS